MKPVIINITNLIGTLVIIGDKESASAQIKESVNDALLKVMTTAHNLGSQESCQGKTSSKLEDSENQE